MTDDDAEIGRLVQERATARKSATEIEKNLKDLADAVTQSLQNLMYKGINSEAIEAYPQVAADLKRFRELDKRVGEISIEFKRRGLE